MSNLIGPLLGNILPYCTGMGGYCTVWVIVMETSDGKKICSASWCAWSDLWGWLSNSAWFCLVSVACKTRFKLSRFAHCIAQKFLPWARWATRALVLAGYFEALPGHFLWFILVQSCGASGSTQFVLAQTKLFTQAAWLTVCGSYFAVHPVI